MKIQYTNVNQINIQACNVATSYMFKKKLQYMMQFF